MKQSSMPLTRRRFCATAAALAVASRPSLAQATSRISVAAIEHDRILAEAALALKLAPHTITSIAAPPQPQQEVADTRQFVATPTFRAHADALIDASAAIAALTAAFVVTKDAPYALAAGRHLFAWFVDPDTRMDPTLQGTQTPAGILDGIPLAEIARALPFLADTAALSPPDLATARAWFAELLQWLTSARNALIAREAKDHTASAWLLLTTAVARLLGDEATLNACRVRFKKPTLRNQIAANGDCPHEVATPFPFRYTLLNFDLLAAACELLSTPFLSLWTYELEDGPGIRSVAAFLYPSLKEPNRWPYIADADHYRDVQRRRPALLFAGRAYDRPEYVDLWRTLPAPPANDPLRASFPVRQPLLWVSRPPHTT